MAGLLSTAVGRLRVVSAIEGLSYALLLFVAMPVKYGLGEPILVQVLGRAHGFLFVLFGAALLHAWLDERWGITRALWLGFLSVVPLGAVRIEKELKALEPAAG